MKSCHIHRLFKFFFVIPALLAWALAAADASATTSFYVSPSGSDTNAGTISKPYRTLAVAVTNLTPGATLYVRAGTYRETLKPTKSGTNGAPITIMAYSNETVTLSGCDVITNSWTLTTNSIYTNSVAWDLGEGYNQVFVDGVLQHEAQSPNWTAANSLLNPPTNSVTVYLGGRINSSSFGGQADGFYTGARFCGGIGSRWWWQTAVITNSSGNNLYMNTNAVCSGDSTVSYGWWPDFDGTASDTGGGFVYGKLNLLNTNGEWYLQTNAVAPNTLYLMSTNSPDSHLVELKRRVWCVSLTNCSYVTVNGLVTRAGAIQISGTGNVLTNINAGYLSHFMTWANPNNNPGGDQLQGCGIYVSGTSNTVIGCSVHDTSGSGITLTGSGHLATRNHIYNTDYSGTYASSLFDYGGTGDTITFNTMHDTGRDVLRPFGTGLTVMYNNLYNAGKLCCDLGVIYVISMDGEDANGEDTRIAYNWLHDNYNSSGDYRSPLIYFDRYCQHFLVDHNVCWNNSGDDAIRLNRPNKYMRAYNNTLFKSDNFGTHVYTKSPPYITEFTNWTAALFPESLTNNLYLSTTPQTQLMNWSGYDFRLTNGAAAINAGVVKYDATNDLDITYGYVGAKPDLGACEYTGSFWKAGTNGWAVEQPMIQVVSNGNISATNATCYGSLLSAGISPSSVLVYWGLNDGGADTNNWSNHMTLVTSYTGSFINVTQAISGLASGSSYYFRYCAVNTNGASWSDALTFVTIPTPTILVGGGGVAGGNLILLTATLSNFSYRLDSNTNLMAGAGWTPVSTNAGTGLVMTNTVPVAPSANQKFFRYVVQ